MRTPITAIPLILPIVLASCAKRENPYVGEWHYDRQSLRETAHAAALESVTDSGRSAISEAERSELRASVDQDHDGWDKRLTLRADGSFLATSRIGSANLEEHAGTWSLVDDAIHLIEEDAETVALARREGRNLVLMMTDHEGTTARMVMLPGQSSRQGQDREQTD